MSIGFHIMFDWLQHAKKMLNSIILLVKQVLGGIKEPSDIKWVESF